MDSEYLSLRLLYWNEWAAATGSTLGIFMLFTASFKNGEGLEGKNICNVYFPWIQALHILLDYFIDRREDALHGGYEFYLSLR